MLRRIVASGGPVLASVAVLVAGVAGPKRVRADATDEALAAHERCATRLSIALLGQTASASLMASPNPTDAVESMLADPAFVERFATFINAQFNPEPGQTLADDASYTLAKYVLTNNRPWHEMFDGKYTVADTVTNDPNGLGYFRSDAWMKRYAGNELAGYRIVSAYRMLQNTTGLKLTAVTNVAGADLSATGRQAAPCNGCHFSKWYALDWAARVLTRRKGTGTTMTFTPPTDGPQPVANTTVSSDADLVAALVGSENFRVNACRLAFQYLYARAENSCEGQLFDKCVDAFVAAGTMQSAVATIAKDPTFCQ
jgi:hypothetical protein